MKTLEEEAKRYAKIPINLHIDEEERYYRGSDVREYDSFIAGANSKWVQSEKIKAQIEAIRAVDTYGIKHMLEYYEQQLNQIENGETL